jgi:O-antigen/teichoic acid export membrane protein
MLFQSSTHEPATRTNDTKAVLWIEATGTLLAVIMAILAILTVGMKGAAMAVPLYFGCQLVVSVVLARRAVRQNVDENMRGSERHRISASCRI